MKFNKKLFAKNLFSTKEFEFRLKFLIFLGSDESSQNLDSLDDLKSNRDIAVYQPRPSEIYKYEFSQNSWNIFYSEVPTTISPYYQQYPYPVYSNSYQSPTYSYYPSYSYPSYSYYPSSYGSSNGGGYGGNLFGLNGGFNILGFPISSGFGISLGW